MEVRLAQDILIDNIGVVKAEEENNCLIAKLQASGPTPNKCSAVESASTQSERAYLERLRQGIGDAKRSHSSSSSSRHDFCIHLISTPASATKVTVRVHGLICDVLHGLAGKEGISLKLQVGLMAIGQNSHSPVSSALLQTQFPPVFTKEEMEPIDTVNATCIGRYWEIKNVPFSRAIFGFSNLIHPSYFLSGVVSISLVREQQEDGDDDKLRICRSILNEGIQSDIAIVASNGTALECNRAFLAAHSPVFAAMFEVGLKETQTNRIEMVDMSEPVARAFLTYLYTWDEKAARENSKVALELLKAGHKYDIPHLEERMKDIFRRCEPDWCDAEVAMRLFLFVRNLEDDCADHLKRKAVDILKSKTKEMVETQFYRDIIQENAEVAADAAFELFAIGFSTGSSDDDAVVGELAERMQELQCPLQH